MRVKQTARKSTAARDTGDPLNSRMRVLETKRSSLGSSASTYIRNQGNGASSSSRQSFPIGVGLGKGGKRIAFGDVKVRPRLANGEAALKEIKRLQASTHFLIPRAVFHRLIREITQNLTLDPPEKAKEIRYQVAALMALQEATESYMTRLFEDAYLCTLHAKRVTLFTKDMDLCRRLRQA